VVDIVNVYYSAGAYYVRYGDRAAKEYPFLIDAMSEAARLSNMHKCCSVMLDNVCTNAITVRIA
jgi:hypothetical protein